MRNKKLAFVVLGSLFAALIFVATLIHLPIFSTQGYFHLGDSIIYIAASMLPFPFAAAAAAVGGALSDILGGYFIWAPFTAVIKIMNVLPFAAAKKLRKNQSKRIDVFTVAACVVSGIITVGLYFLASRVIYGSFAAAAADIFGNTIQAIASAVVYLIFSAFPKPKFFNELNKKDDKNG